jgi:hypothetical protein
MMYNLSIFGSWFPAQNPDVAEGAQYLSCFEFAGSSYRSWRTNGFWTFAK